MRKAIDDVTLEVDLVPGLTSDRLSDGELVQLSAYLPELLKDLVQLSQSEADKE